MKRIEKDLLGEKEINNNIYYGINTLRAIENFGSRVKTNINLIYGIVEIKKAAAIINNEIGILLSEIKDSIVFACDEILTGEYNDQFVVDALQGGAGTSTNMNVNEVIANIALEKLGHKKGEYDIIHPMNHVNLSQSTNDVYPTGLKIASIRQLRLLADEYSLIQETLQEKENEFSNDIKLGRTQLMDAVPITFGQMFGSFARVASRDRWRIYKVEERLRVMNIGGTAVGTGINADQKYIFKITSLLQRQTGLGLSRSEFPLDTTQNQDVFVEVSGMIKTAASSLIKICNDLRFLASGPSAGLGEIILEPVQQGSTIMPGKVNPVILECAVQSAMKVIANDSIITHAASSGNFELNAFMPAIADAILESLEVLTNTISMLRTKVFESIKINRDKGLENVNNSIALATALINHLGYDEASMIAKESHKTKRTIREIVLDKELLSNEELDNILNVFELTKVGIPGK
ncbi:aspartate ammonia-lyase [Mycoplasmatota bacterium WC44]